MPKFYLITLAALLILTAAWRFDGDGVTFEEREDRIDVLVDGQLVTSYLFTCPGPKPCLYPLRSPDGTVMTRHYPLEEVAGERQDHPHHTGIYFTYDHVNDVNFWDIHDAPPEIRHIEVLQMEGGSESGTLAVRKHWVGSDGRVLLEEIQTMTFAPGDDAITIDLTMTLTPPQEEVVFEDSKEGMLGVRVADWLSEQHGTGSYLSMEGDKGEESIWGKRASWVRLEGEKDGNPHGIAIMHHPSSVNYPTYWHARGYGLFAANPLGQGVFESSRGLENPKYLRLKLAKGEPALFAFRLLVYDGRRTQSDLNNAFTAYRETSPPKPQ